MSTVTRQIYNGMILVGKGLITFLLFIATIAGLLLISRSRSHGEVAIGVAGLTIVAVLLWVTSHLWSRWIPAVLILGALKGLTGLISGTTLSPPFVPISRLMAAETVVYMIATALLTLRYVKEPPQSFQRVAVIVFIFSTCAAMHWEPSHIAFIIGCGALVLATLVRQINADATDDAFALIRVHPRPKR